MSKLDLLPRTYETAHTITEDDFEDAAEVLEVSTEFTDEAILERQVLDSPEEPQTSWVESDSDGTISEQGYLQRCRWRLGNVSHALDVVRDSVDNEADAQQWLTLKMAVLAAKSIGNPYDIVNPMIALEKAGYDFVIRLSIDWGAYQSVANK